MLAKQEAKDDTGEPLDSRRLFDLLYDELRRYARSRMVDERPNHTLQATAVVNELWLRLGKAGRAQEWNSRGHFFASMALSIRRILVDYAHAKNAAKRGGGVSHQPIDDTQLVVDSDVEQLVQLDRALGSARSYRARLQRGSRKFQPEVLERQESTRRYRDCSR